MAFLDDVVRKVQTEVEQKFLFRKIGLPYDYASPADDFPAKAFATAKEARANLPNPAGLGAGYAYSCRNHALLFDAYLLRIEEGIEGESDEQILDRLIGGLIRLDTVAPKSFLVSGLAPDGRGFYAQPHRFNHTAWAFALLRGLDTAAIAPESQEKFRSIAGKWLDRLRRDKFRLTAVDGKPSQDGDVSRPDAEMGPLFMAMLMMAAKASGHEKDYEGYVTAAEEDARIRFAPREATPDALGDLAELLWRQAALSVVAKHDPEAERVELAAARMRDNAAVAARHVDSWRRWDRSLIDRDVDLNWRQFPKASLEESPLGFTPPESWQRLANELPLRNALFAMYTLLLTGDAALVEPHAASMEECIATQPWDKVVTLSALAPVVGIHARGVELGLWDKTLFESRREAPFSETSIAAKYLEPDYDDVHPEQAGHRGTPPGKKGKDKDTPAAGKAEGGGGGRKRRRKRRR